MGYQENEPEPDKARGFFCIAPHWEQLILRTRIMVLPEIHFWAAGNA